MKLLDTAGRAQIKLPPKQYGKQADVTFAQPTRICNSSAARAPVGYRWLHLQGNPRTGT